MRWDAGLYERSFGYVAAYGEALIDLLDPRPDERIIDLGCGTGTLTSEVAARGARVLGLDSSTAMIDQARGQHPELDFEVADAHVFTFREQADAVFSNAALHWMTDPDAVIARVWAALRPGGRFVAEMGASGNCATIIEAVHAAAAELGIAGEVRSPWYFPTPAEQAARLEKGGFEVRWLHCFDRPTPLDQCPDGIADWLRMFGAEMLRPVPADLIDRLLDRVNELTAPALYRDGIWTADYRRLRFIAARL
ncbi:MAG: methyltransferase domain-containing protein [Streptosporangiales bacterium]|nr:methyltransferase domain-containing protein [Streptosporangiales bacterium]